MSALRLAFFELRRFRGPMRRAAIAFMVIVPTLYAGVYLYSSWDPYGRVDKIPVAVVNQDRPVEVNGKTIDAGRQFTDQLRVQRQFDWKFVDETKALDGLKSGRYYFVITVPPDFSRRLTSPATGTPERAALHVELNDANGFIVGIMAKTAESELQAQINTAAQTAYAETGLGDLQDVRSGLKEAAQGATKLKTGAQEAHAGAKKLSSGLNQLATGAGTLATGSAKVAAGTDELATAASAASRAASRAAARVQEAARTVQELAAKAPGNVGSAVSDAKAATSALLAANPDLADDPTFKALRAQVDEATSDAKDADALGAAADTIASQASSITSRANDARDQVDTAVDKVDQLDRGANQVAAGAEKLRTAAREAHSGASKLSTGNGKLATGAATLSQKLTDAYKKVPSADAQARSRNAEVLGNPVDVQSGNLHPAKVYGRGVAPFFLSIGLWVFGLIAYLLLRPVAGEALAGGLRSPTVAMAAWLLAAMVGTVAATVLFAIAELGLGLDADQPVLLLGLLWLTIWTFTAIDHALRLSLGTVGDVLSLVLLVVQLGGAGGLYPLQISPQIFQILHPILPMTYTIDAFRYAISGGETAHLTRDVIVIVGFLALALSGAVAAVARQRQWTLARLKPELEI
ncbi:MAG TPA: YhgE/Pip domain-containing protein [Baekduia sp.]|nr:YhgE/Pip domain-containing protein [Baekduia sp.]